MIRPWWRVVCAVGSALAAVAAARLFQMRTDWYAHLERHNDRWYE